MKSWVPVVAVTSWAFVVAEASLADAVTQLFAVVTRLVVAAAVVVVGQPVVAAVAAVPYSDAETQLDLAVVAS